jgi:hypothetical protein
MPAGDEEAARTAWPAANATRREVVGCIVDDGEILDNEDHPKPETISSSPSLSLYMELALEV